MKSPRNIAFLRARALSVFIGSACLLLASPSTPAAGNVLLFDSTSRFGASVNIDERSNWKPVPRNLFSLEVDPAKAISDPGYSGREYSFKGDAVVATRNLTAVFWSAKGRLVIYAKTPVSLPANASPRDSSFGAKILEFTPLELTSHATISHCEVVRNGGDELVLEAFFSADGSPEVAATFTFDKTDIIAVKPSEKMSGSRLLGFIEYGIVPSFIGDDLIFGPSEYQSAESLNIPAENVFLGLLKGENQMLVMTWPTGKQRLKMNAGKAQSGKRETESVDFQNDGQTFYLGFLGSQGVWHREELKPSYLEKDVASDWKRPFPAKWITQLSEAGVRTRFPFRDSKGTIWRGVPGSYSFPVWFSEDTAFYHLSKKVAPKGESIIYFLEGEETPPGMMTPVDIMNGTLGRQISENLLDVSGRKLRTHHRRGGDGVRRACTCGCTEAIQAVFEAGQEFAKKDYVDEAVDDMVYFVRRHVERIEEYRHFVDETIKFMQSKAKSSPDLKPYLDSLEQTLQQIPQEYSVQKENMKSLPYAQELATQTIALANKKDAKNLEAYLELGKAWRAMGGAQDYVLAQCHVITRRFFQESGFTCVQDPKAVAVAEEIRTRCRQILRNPDGYEIWGDY